MHPDAGVVSELGGPDCDQSWSSITVETPDKDAIAPNGRA